MYKALLILFLTTLAFGNIAEVTLVKGDAYVERGIDSLEAYNGMELLRYDTVQTGEGQLQMHFSDRSVISLAKESRLVIKEYLYSQDSKNTAATFKIEKGFIKIITGSIAKMMPEFFVMETPNTKITPYGTIWSIDLSEEKEIYRVLDGKIALVFNDGTERKIELLAGEMLHLNKSFDGKIKNFNKSKIVEKSINNDRYWNTIEQKMAIVNEERTAYKDFVSRSVTGGSNPNNAKEANPKMFKE